MLWFLAGHRPDNFRAFGLLAIEFSRSAPTGPNAVWILTRSLAIFYTPAPLAEK